MVIRLDGTWTRTLDSVQDTTQTIEQVVKARCAEQKEEQQKARLPPRRLMEPRACISWIA